MKKKLLTYALYTLIIGVAPYMQGASILKYLFGPSLTDLMNAIKSNNDGKVRQYLATSPELLAQRIETGVSPLQCAITYSIGGRTHELEDLREKLPAQLTDKQTKDLQELDERLCKELYNKRIVIIDTCVSTLCANPKLIKYNDAVDSLKATTKWFDNKPLFNKEKVAKWVQDVNKAYGNLPVAQKPLLLN